MVTLKSLNKFLDQKALYYDKIDYDTIRASWDILKQTTTLPYVIHLVGTNGKGSTGRFLAHYLNQLSYKTLHYSSPHILKFNERIWINGSDVDDDTLEKSHQKLHRLLPNEILEKLTYFEYTTLLALLLSSGFDYLVLEAGLGGEFDATNVVKNDLSLITTIDLDHQSFLGDTVKEIATTKLRSCDTKMIVNKQVHPEVYEVAQGYDYMEVEEFDVSRFTFMPEYLLQNLKLALTALKYLDIHIDMNLFKDIKLFGRCQRIEENITIDVGHNPLAARAIVEEFRKKDEKVSLIYNSFKDKDYKEVLKILEPIVTEVLILKVSDNRMVNKEILTNICDNLSLSRGDFENIDEKKNYLVFGSFSVVEEFIKVRSEK